MCCWITNCYSLNWMSITPKMILSYFLNKILRDITKVIKMERRHVFQLLTKITQYQKTGKWLIKKFVWKIISDWKSCRCGTMIMQRVKYFDLITIIFLLFYSFVFVININCKNHDSTNNKSTLQWFGTWQSFFFLNLTIKENYYCFV